MSFYEFSNIGEFEYECFDFNEVEVLDMFIFEYPSNKGYSLNKIWSENKTKLSIHLAQGYKKADKPSFSLHMISERAKGLLEPLIKEHVEFLPLKYNKETYYVVNVLTVIDCFDYENTEFHYDDSGNRRLVKKWAFDKNKIENAPIFTVKDYEGIYIIVSENFKKIVDKNNLTNFCLEKLS